MSANYTRCRFDHLFSNRRKVLFFILNTPVPRPRPHLDARDAFLYVVLFGTLYVSAFNLGNRARRVGHFLRAEVVQLWRAPEGANSRLPPVLWPGFLFRSRSHRACTGRGLDAARALDRLEIRPRDTVLRIPRQNLSQHLDRCRQLALARERGCQIVSCVQIRRIPIEGFSILGDGLVESACRAEDDAEIVMSEGVIEPLERATEVSLGLFRSAQIAQTAADVRQSLKVAREFLVVREEVIERLLVAPEGSQQPPELHEHVGVVGVEFKRAS